jgi:hypothetical protein
LYSPTAGGLVGDALEDALQHARDQTLLFGVDVDDASGAASDVHGVAAGSPVGSLPLNGLIHRVVVGALHGESLARTRLAVRDEAPVA